MKSEEMDWNESIENLSKNYPYANFLHLIKWQSEKENSGVNFKEKQDEALKNNVHQSYLNHLILHSDEWKEKKQEIEISETKEVEEEKIETAALAPIVEWNEPTKIESIEKYIDELNKNEALDLIHSLINKHLNEEDQQHLIKNLTQTNDELTEPIDFPLDDLEFDLNEKMSFYQWIKLSDGIQKTASKNRLEIENTTSQEKIIDKFLENNPKIIAPKEDEQEKNYENKPLEYFTIMTETLAQIYIEQKKYDKAIEAYQSLSLKYPEKSVYFADQIKKIEELKDKI